ncbi:MAG: 30S ribosomal protein S3 [Candidatus Atribacteria bacterium]|nr:30S ribosomal protein S3 [Candidatus Atribacteria bacterium]
MGQKVNPIGLRLGIIRGWQSRWYADKKYREYLAEDLRIRQFVREKLQRAGVSGVEVERLANQVKVIIKTSRPGIVIGRKGAEVENLRQSIQKLVNNPNVQITVDEIKVPEIDAYLVAENVAFQIERRVSYRRAMKQAITRALRAGAIGIKISCSGRLSGAEIAREEWYREGRLPLQTLRADIDFGFTEANTTYGKIGVKVWIFKGEVIKTGEVLEGVPSTLVENRKEDTEAYVDSEES